MSNSIEKLESWMKEQTKNRSVDIYSFHINEDFLSKESEYYTILEFIENNMYERYWYINIYEFDPQDRTKEIVLTELDLIKEGECETFCGLNYLIEAAISRWKKL